VFKSQKLKKKRSKRLLSLKKKNLLKNLLNPEDSQDRTLGRTRSHTKILTVKREATEQGGSRGVIRKSMRLMEIRKKK